MKRLKRQNRGAAMMEYIILLGLMAILAITMAARIGWNLSYAYNGASASLSGARSAEDEQDPECPQYPYPTDGFYVGPAMMGESGFEMGIVLLNGEAGGCNTAHGTSMIGNQTESRDEVFVPGSGGDFMMGFGGSDTYYINVAHSNGPYFGYFQINDVPGNPADIDTVIFDGWSIHDVDVIDDSTSGAYLYQKSYNGIEYNDLYAIRDMGPGNGVLLEWSNSNAGSPQPPGGGIEVFVFDDVTLDREQWDIFVRCGPDTVRTTMGDDDVTLTAAGACGIGGTNTYRYSYSDLGSSGLVYVADLNTSQNDAIIFTDWMPEDIITLSAGINRQELLVVDRAAYEADPADLRGVRIRNFYYGSDGEHGTVENFEWSDGNRMTRDQIFENIISPHGESLSRLPPS